MPNHFSVRDVIFTPTDTGVKVVVETDVLCRLICRQTSTVPQIHKKPVLRRGVWLNDDVRFCFVAYSDHEQEEAGDTLIHTFIKEPWTPCTTKWMYFWATIDGEVCVSTSAMFAHHNPVPPYVPPVLVRYAWSRLFTHYGSFIARAAGTGIAATFHITETPTWADKFHLFSRNRENVSVMVSLYEADDDNKPTGPSLGFVVYNLENGVEDGGDGATDRVYRHIVTIPYIYTPGKNYALVSMTLTNSAQWWINFRRQDWIGDEDEGTENNVCCHYSQDAGASWILFPPSHQNYEYWGTHP